MSKKDIIWGNFLGGLSWGIGSAIGAALIVTVFGAILNRLGVFNAILNFLQQLPQVPQF